MKRVQGRLNKRALQSGTRGRKLKRYHNYKEYWVCGSCNRPRRANTDKRKPCYKCKSAEPLRLRIHPFQERGDNTHRITGEEDKCTLDSWKSAGIRKAAAAVRREIFPNVPVRKIMSMAQTPAPTPKKQVEWLCQVFLHGERFRAYLPRDICLMGTIDEVRDYMSEKKMMQIRIPSDLHKWLKLHAAENDTTMTKIILSYLRRLRRNSETSVKVDQI